jgi:superfamily II DNA or RNA helicase
VAARVEPAPAREDGAQVPTIYDNIVNHLDEELKQRLVEAQAADFCTGYFRLRGWAELADLVDGLEGTDESCCRVLVGMHRPPEEEMRAAQSAIRRHEYPDGPTLARLRREAARSFREQIEFGLPTAGAEAILRQLARQLRERKVRVKLFLRYPLHAKLYIVRRRLAPPLAGYVGSSNLTFAGLAGQGELNVDVWEQDAAQKLQAWFEERWDDPYAVDISDELAELIETSWAREALVRPYLVYLKMAFHLSADAREGEREFKLPADFQGVLLDFQTKAVSMAAHHLHRHGGVLLGDVVGLGKTLMATAVAKILQEDDGSNTLIICPPKLMDMWRWHVGQYGLAGEVVSLGAVGRELERKPRYRLVVIDESHNLRNRDGQRWRAIREYLTQNEPRVLLVTATPYNKQYTDLSNQLRLFVDEDRDLRVRPERFFQGWAKSGLLDADFQARFNALPTSIRAFEESEFPDDWRDLMSLFLVRRTRQFIMKNYATKDEAKQRYFVTLNGEPSYFPERKPRKLTFALDEDDPNDHYARLYTQDVVAVIEELALPRYGLANYLAPDAHDRANAAEKTVLDNLNRAGRRLLGFCRSNLFKRLESSGFSFLLSVERHILRNMVTLHALENGLEVPIGTQSAAMLDTLVTDVDRDTAKDDDGEGDEGDPEQDSAQQGREYQFYTDLAYYRKRAEEVYARYKDRLDHLFDWLDPKLFKPDLSRALLADAKQLLKVLSKAPTWQADKDAKLDALQALLTRKHGKEKVLVFTQFADTALYLAEELKARGVTDLEAATGLSRDPTALARRFSPTPNGGLQRGETELDRLVSTDVLAEGQNLQDAHITVNYDLPWAIIRLIQRAGRVDRIGQKHDTILVYSFMPAEGVEKIITLRTRLSVRLKANQEVIGTDESFFGEAAANKLRDIYAGKDGAYDDDEDDEVDLASLALQVWNSAAEDDRKDAQGLPSVISATRPAPADAETQGTGPGLITYLRYPDGIDALVHVDDGGRLVSQSLTAAFSRATCSPDTPALERMPNHYDLVESCVQHATREVSSLGGHLGTLRSSARKAYERLKTFRERARRGPNLFSSELAKRLEPAFQALFRFPLRERARDSLGRQMRLGITDEGLAEMLIRLHEEDRLVNAEEERETPEPQILCSLATREAPELTP